MASHSFDKARLSAGPKSAEALAMMSDSFSNTVAQSVFH
jgi:hypothetical protein